MDAPRRGQTSAERLITVLTRSMPTSLIRGCTLALVPNGALCDKCLLALLTVWQWWPCAVPLVPGWRWPACQAWCQGKLFPLASLDVGGGAGGDTRQAAGTLALNHIRVRVRSRSPLCHHHHLWAARRHPWGTVTSWGLSEIYYGYDRFMSPLFFLFIKMYCPLWGQPWISSFPRFIPLLLQGDDDTITSTVNLPQIW